MVTAGIILAFSLMFILAAGAMGVAAYGIREAARTQVDLFQHWSRAQKSVNVQELTKADSDAKKSEVDLTMLKQSWEAEIKKEIGEGKIPMPKPKLVKAADGRSFDMAELEVL